MLKFLSDKIYAQSIATSQLLRTRILSNELLSNSLLVFLLVIALLTNAFGLFSPILGSNDSNFYATVAKHIITSGDWINLTFDYHDWLDKPHFPFWIIALSYKLFGISTFAYVLPGFIFNLIGVRYTYLLARYLYTPQIALVASIIYLTSIHLMLSAIDVRAEAYLLGEIIPACYYWLLYSKTATVWNKLLIQGALFTALAMMTKGPFVILMIISGVVGVWIYQQNYRQCSYKKWLLATLMVMLFIMPEIIALALQFDYHPEKIIFGHQAVSGVKFFFWDSQIGRFLGNGPITEPNFHHNFGHYFYFVHTLLWSFLPWSLLLLVALWHMYQELRLSGDIPKIKEQKENYIYLLSTLIPQFIVFSVSKFQLDHYTNILIPILSIICAVCIFNKATRSMRHPILYIQIILAYLILTLVTISALLLFNARTSIFILGLCITCIAMFGVFNNNRLLNKAIVFPVFSISLVFILAMLVNGKIYARYDAGYQIDKYLNMYPNGLLVDYKVNNTSLELHTSNTYMRINNVQQLKTLKPPFYLVTDSDEWSNIHTDFIHAIAIESVEWIPQEHFIPTLFNLAKRQLYTTNLVVELIK